VGGIRQHLIPLVRDAHGNRELPVGRHLERPAVASADAHVEHPVRIEAGNPHQCRAIVMRHRLDELGGMIRALRHQRGLSHPFEVRLLRRVLDARGIVAEHLGPAVRPCLSELEVATVPRPVFHLFRMDLALPLEIELEDLGILAIEAGERLTERRDELLVRPLGIAIAPLHQGLPEETRAAEHVLGHPRWTPSWAGFLVGRPGYLVRFAVEELRVALEALPSAVAAVVATSLESSPRDPAYLQGGSCNPPHLQQLSA
jgi:hypothetical protein